MSLRIRLSRAGARKRPLYRIVLANSRSPRDGRFIERLGSYNPLLPQGHAERVVLKEKRIRHWLNIGAAPTERVARFLGQVGLISTTSCFYRPQVARVGEGFSGDDQSARAELE